MRFKIVYQMSVQNSSTQSNVQNTVMPLVLKTIDKYMQVRNAYPGCQLVIPLMIHHVDIKYAVNAKDLADHMSHQGQQAMPASKMHVTCMHLLHGPPCADAARSKPSQMRARCCALQAS